MKADDIKQRLDALRIVLNNARGSVSQNADALESITSDLSGLETRLLVATDISQGHVVALNTLIAQVDSLTAEVMVPEPPPVVIPPPPPPPPPAPVKARLWVDGPILRTKTGAPANWRGMELMWGPDSDAFAVQLCKNIKAFGANAISPLFQRGQEGIVDVRECLKAARDEGLMVGVNADHTSGGTAWIKRADIVEVCNQYDNIMLESQVELGSIDTMTRDQWLTNAKTFIKGMRDAGHKAPIKVGAPSGGRLPQWGVQVGKELVDFDPEHSLIFTWQAYWKAATSTGWSYASQAGMRSSGIAGALEMLAQIEASGLCFIVGLDGADDVGVTPWLELANQIHKVGKQGHQWWAWMVGDVYGNGVMAGNRDTTPKNPFGPAVKAMLQAQTAGKMAAL